MTSTQISPARKWATVAVGCLANVVLGIDLTALHLAIPGLVADLDPSANQILWIADSYGFALAGFLITMGVLGDRIGRKRLFLFGTLAFAATSLLTAYAWNAETLILARTLLGVSGATIMPSALSVTRNVFTDPKERTTAVGIGMGVGALGVGLGPVFGGLMLDHFWWGSVFLINVPLMAVTCVLALFIWPESKDPNPHRFDLVSVPLSLVGVLGFVYAVKEAAANGVMQGRVAISLVLGLLAGIAFVVRQQRISYPLIDVSLFRQQAFTGSVLANMFSMFALIAQSLLFAQYFQLVLGWSPLKAGLAGLPGGVCAMIGGALAAPLITAFGRARVVGIGMAVAAAGFGLYMLSGTSADYLVLLVAMVPCAMGMGMAMTVTGDTILASVPKDRAGAASAISETATELGGALGMAVLGSVLNGVYRNEIDVPAGVPESARGSVEDSIGSALTSAVTMPADVAGRVVDAARSAFVDGMHMALLTSAALALLAGVAGLVLLRGVPKVLEDPDLAVAEGVETTEVPGQGTAAPGVAQVG
ncbi:MFS transporter [Yinghuangia seranimata]|uniref:MFS transporter n=1 Tax=Yinghuangia seranimata TaxID=408067 RepID=UPI00248CC1BC|nr:MFS transporter [Yinghuangia seranimata]MDI2130594.1 MFS transporter [Yinghuangia seranimata]